jgi:hypothetical protein
MKLPLSMLAVSILLLTLSHALQAEIYRWVDENGVVNHSDSLPPGLSTTNTDVKPVAQPGQSVADAHVPDMDVEIRGVVQDAKGDPLHGVTMTIVERHTVPARLSSKEVRKKKKVNGNFVVSCRNCPIVKLRFRAPGYTSTEVKMEFTAEENAEIARWLEDRMTGATAPSASRPIRITRDNVRVVLQEKSKFPRLTRIEGQVSLTQDGPLRVLAGKSPKLGQEPYSYAKEKFNAENTAEETAMLLASLAGTSYKTLVRAHEANTLHTRRDRLHIELAGVEGGFVKVTPTARARNDKMKSMQQAPEHGYKKQLDIAMNETEGVYFYCKIGSFYGKGHITHEPRMRSRSGLYTHMEILMNRDGGRNLRSEY